MKLAKHGETDCSCHTGPPSGWGGRIRRRLLDSAQRRFGPAAPWVQRHAAGCPRCRQRLAGLARVDIALSVIKSQPHQFDLLTRANAAAIRMLGHHLRQSEAADKLKEAKPKPSFAERYAGHQGAITNVAACIALLMLTKVGIFTSLDKARTRGEAAMKQYYTTRAGEDLAGEVFKS
ncbi:MAG TPA: hypothetical protein VLI39_02600 [Sedimentisphaerales bacterium]|nr:hypothetical protein [Sedimentisphaerales bacterium]